MKYLVDSNVLSEPTKEKPNPKVLSWLATNGDDVCTSVLVFGEIERGIDKLGNTKRARRLQEWYEELSEGLYSTQRVLELDRHVISRWAVIYNREEQLLNRKPPVIDSLLAASAEHHGMTLVTRNKKDFSGAVPILNPWE